MVHINTVIVTGNLTTEVSLKEIGDGKYVANFGLANNRYYTKNGEKCQETVFFSVTCWNNQAVNCSKHLSKGGSVIIDGSLSQDEWTDADGKKHSKIYVTARRVEFMGSNRKPAQGDQDIATGYSNSASESLGSDDSEPPF